MEARKQKLSVALNQLFHGEADEFRRIAEYCCVFRRECAFLWDSLPSPHLFPSEVITQAVIVSTFEFVARYVAHEVIEHADTLTPFLERCDANKVSVVLLCYVEKCRIMDEDDRIWSILCRTCMETRLVEAALHAYSCRPTSTGSLECLRQLLQITTVVSSNQDCASFLHSRNIISQFGSCLKASAPESTSTTCIIDTKVVELFAACAATLPTVEENVSKLVMSLVDTLASIASSPPPQDRIAPVTKTAIYIVTTLRNLFQQASPLVFVTIKNALTETGFYVVVENLFSKLLVSATQQDVEVVAQAMADCCFVFRDPDPPQQTFASTPELGKESFARRMLRLGSSVGSTFKSLGKQKPNPLEVEESTPTHSPHHALMRNDVVNPNALICLQNVLLSVGDSQVLVVVLRVLEELLLTSSGNFDVRALMLHLSQSVPSSQPQAQKSSIAFLRSCYKKGISPGDEVGALLSWILKAKLPSSVLKEALLLCVSLLQVDTVTDMIEACIAGTVVGLLEKVASKGVEAIISDNQDAATTLACVLPIVEIMAQKSLADSTQKSLMDTSVVEVGVKLCGGNDEALHNIGIEVIYTQIHNDSSPASAAAFFKQLLSPKKDWHVIQHALLPVMHRCFADPTDTLSTQGGIEAAVATLESGLGDADAVGAVSILFEMLSIHESRFGNTPSGLRKLKFVDTLSHVLPTSAALPEAAQAILTASTTLYDEPSLEGKSVESYGKYTVPNNSLAVVPIFLDFVPSMQPLSDFADLVRALLAIVSRTPHLQSSVLLKWVLEGQGPKELLGYLHINHRVAASLPIDSSVQSLQIWGPILKHQPLCSSITFQFNGGLCLSTPPFSKEGVTIRAALKLLSPCAEFPLLCVKSPDGREMRISFEDDIFALYFNDQRIVVNEKPVDNIDAGWNAFVVVWTPVQLQLYMNRVLHGSVRIPVFTSTSLTLFFGPTNNEVAGCAVSIATIDIFDTVQLEDVCISGTEELTYAEILSDDDISRLSNGLSVGSRATQRSVHLAHFVPHVASGTELTNLIPSSPMTCILCGFRTVAPVGFVPLARYFVSRGGLPVLLTWLGEASRTNSGVEVILELLASTLQSTACAVTRLPDFYCYISFFLRQVNLCLTDASIANLMTMSATLGQDGSWIVRNAFAVVFILFDVDLWCKLRAESLDRLVSTAGKLFAGRYSRRNAEFLQRTACFTRLLHGFVRCASNFNGKSICGIVTLLKLFMLAEENPTNSICEVLSVLFHISPQTSAVDPVWPHLTLQSHSLRTTHLLVVSFLRMLIEATDSTGFSSILASQITPGWLSLLCDKRQHPCAVMLLFTLLQALLRQAPSQLTALGQVYYPLIFQLQHFADEDMLLVQLLGALCGRSIDINGGKLPSAHVKELLGLSGFVPQTQFLSLFASILLRRLDTVCLNSRVRKSSVFDPSRRCSLRWYRALSGVMTLQRFFRRNRGSVEAQCRADDIMMDVIAVASKTLKKQGVVSAALQDIHFLHCMSAFAQNVDSGSVVRPPPLPLKEIFETPQSSNINLSIASQSEKTDTAESQEDKTAFEETVRGDSDDEDKDEFLFTREASAIFRYAKDDSELTASFNQDVLPKQQAQPSLLPWTGKLVEALHAAFDAAMTMSCEGLYGVPGELFFRLLYCVPRTAEYHNKLATMIIGFAREKLACEKMTTLDEALSANVIGLVRHVVDRFVAQCIDVVDVQTLFDSAFKAVDKTASAGLVSELCAQGGRVIVRLLLDSNTSEGVLDAVLQIQQHVMREDWISIDFIAQTLGLVYDLMMRTQRENTAIQSRLYRIVHWIACVYATTPAITEVFTYFSIRRARRIDVWKNGFDSALRHDSEAFFTFFDMRKHELSSVFKKLPKQKLQLLKAADIDMMVRYSKQIADFHIIVKAVVLSDEGKRSLLEATASKVAEPFSSVIYPLVSVTQENTSCLRIRHLVKELTGAKHYIDSCGNYVPYIEGESNPSDEPLSLQFLHVPSLICPVSPAISTALDEQVQKSGLKLTRSAVTLLKYALSPSEKFVSLSNGFRVEGLEIIPVLIVLTDKRLLIFSSSGVTSSGDMFLASPDALSFSVDEDVEQGAAKPTGMREALQRLRESFTGSITKAHMVGLHHSRAIRRTAGTVSGEFRWTYALANLRCVHNRWFQHVNAAIEIDVDLDKGVFLAVLDFSGSMTEVARDRLVKELKAQCSKSVLFIDDTTRTQVLTASTLLWQRGLLSNLDYLTALNNCANRTTKDWNQYPVAPWVLSNFKDAELDLNNKLNFRNLATPIGVQTPEREAEVKQRYLAWCDNDTPRFHYGTHYSSSAGVIHFFVRCQPFASAALQYHGGKFDRPDRLFQSIESTYFSCTTSSTDCKELTPEFYTACDFLINLDKTEFGTKQDGTKVDSVMLPVWAGNSYPRFLLVLRAALEHPYVSADFSSWVDLIFGFKQRGEAAEAALNVYHYLSYNDLAISAIQSAKTQEERDAIISQISNFGQTPRQLFAVPHVKRAIDSKTLRIPTILDRIDKYQARDLACVFPKLPQNFSSGSEILQLVSDGSNTAVAGTRNAFIAGRDGSVCFLLSKAENHVFLVRTKDGTYCGDVPFTPPCSPISCMNFGKLGALAILGTESGALYKLTAHSLTLQLELKESLLGHTCPVRRIVRSGRLCLLVSITKDAKDPPILWRLMRESAAFLHRLDTAPVAVDDPVVDAVIDEQNGKIVCFTESASAVIFDFSGRILGSGTQQNLSRLICASIFKYSEWSLGCTSLFVTGHENGGICFWKCALDLTSKQESGLIKITCCGTVTSTTTLAPVTCIKTVEDRLAVVTGHQNGVTKIWVGEEQSDVNPISESSVVL